MANWKKVLVSGSDINVAQITSSELPAGGDDDKVIVINSDGHLKQVAQSDIQGTTEATFLLTGNPTSDLVSFDATAHTMSFDGNNNSTVTVTGNSALTTVTFNLPPNTVSGSSQIDLTSTIGYTSFSASLASDIQDNKTGEANNSTNITSLQQEIDNLQLTASNLAAASTSIASDLTTLEGSSTTLETSITALNDATSSFLLASDTGSFVISASVISADADGIEVNANGAQGIQIGLPTDVTVDGTITADELFLVGYENNNATTAIIAGHTEFGNDSSDVHNFTGSLNITGALNINNTGDIIFNNITVDNTLTPTDLVVRDPVTGKLHKAGTGVTDAISGSFDSVSASLAEDIAAIDGGSVATNTTAISNLEIISQSLVDSASFGIFFQAVGDSGNSIKLGNSASFIASGAGLSVDQFDNGNGNGAIRYYLDHGEVGDAINAFSSSQQLQNTLDTIYVELSDAPISGAEQLQDLGFITQSDFDELDGVPDGLISGAAAGGGQGQITFNGSNTVTLQNLGTTGTPTFAGLTINGNMTVTGGTTALNTEQLLIEDQFILINSGALDPADTSDNNKDGGIIVGGGNGEGALFYYDFTSKAWAFRGATDSNKVSHEAVSQDNAPMVPEVFVATVSSSAVNPSGAPKYGNETVAKGQMHINTADDTIWVYV